jgi:hypothetical protein
MIRRVFSMVRNVLAPDGIVVQLVGFADVRSQFPEYLLAMKDAGLEPYPLPLGQGDHLVRRVPNRKWYAKLRGPVDASSELLLFFRRRRQR